MSGERATSWQLRERTLHFAEQPAIMGIVNVTPDSFSDGGKFYGTDAAIAQGLQLAEDGAAILDIGGESTRPYSTPVDADEERARVEPVVAELAKRTNIPISIDTSKSVVARAAIDAGAQILNDVTGLEGDPQMPELAAETGVGVCAMHMQGTPQTMQDAPTYENIVEEIYAYLDDRKQQLLAIGIKPERICLDPGIGFGKTHQHNLTLMKNCSRFLDLAQPILVGHSRKGFIAQLMGDKELDRTAGTLGGSLALATQGVQIIRVHDVAATRHGLAVFAASGGLGV